MAHYHPRDDVPIVHTAQDKLNRSRLAQRLIEAIQHAPLPQVMGVEGDWGSGKTSLLQNLFWRIEKKVPRQTATVSGPGNLQIPQKKALTEVQWTKWFSRTDEGPSDEFLTDENVRAVWFEAWRYQHEPEPVIALLHEIRSQLLTGDKWEQRAKKLWQKMKHGAEVFVQGLFASTNEIISSIQAEVELPLMGKVSAQMADVGKHVRAASDARQARLMAEPLKSEMLHKNLDLAISLFLGDEKEELRSGQARKRRLVIIIDDLDRCTADSVCRLLESIKIHLDLPSCFFVLGLNRRHVETSLTMKLADAFHVSDSPLKEVLLRARASDYVEKICTNLVRIPRPDRESCVALAKHCLEGVDCPPKWKKVASSSFATILDVLLKGRHYVPLPSNPRRIKALCNQFQLTLLNATDWLDKQAANLTNVAPGNKLEAELNHIRLLYIFAALRQFFPEIYRMVEANPRAYSMLHGWCIDPETSLENKIKEKFGKLINIADSVLASDVNGKHSKPSGLHPDPHEGISFFIQELVVLGGDLGDVYIEDLLSAI